ncbi:cyclic nucleotide-binding domain-containing protein [Bradyrhizobium sp. CSA207]|uniref:Crp/Fnr family transcriptional regulator n=1 Tax=Bradyrhizobium sp. CSA207 TaxID=2698826 RepID=UPI0023B126C5|nr:cyclic nucleotide-binding domain-containing protein [Bradyrhizobium sp. CSA207]MDE5440735.1 cyclic nucleotide-binding domain-containing protein [Bradyrhizobium sp. CSA207]
MPSGSADISSILDRILNAAADNLRIAKIFVEMGLDPDNITYDVLFNRILEIVVHNITFANLFAAVGAGFFVATLLMRTMVPLRVANMIGCALFAIFGALSANVSTFLLYLLLLPINALRLRQMLKLVKKARHAAEGDMSIEWLKPFMTERRYRRGDTLFKMRDPANEMFLTVTGKFLVKEINIEILPGTLMGELGFLTPDNRRTGTVECIEDGQVLTITYDRLLEIYFQDPQFGYYFLVLTSQRLLQNIQRLQDQLTAERAATTNRIA